MEEIKNARKPYGYWTEDLLKKEALKYNTKGGFIKNNRPAYSSACYKGILNDICEHMDANVKWTKELIKIQTCM